MNREKAFPHPIRKVSMSIRRALALAALISAILSTAPFRAATAADGWVAGASPVRARLIAAVTGPGGLDEIAAGLEVSLEPGWKTYWRAPGDAGLPPAIGWTGSDNVSAATDFAYPAPHRFTVLGIDTVGYEGDVVFPIRLKPERPGEAIAARAQVDLLICAEICVPERLALTLDLTAGPANPSEHANAIAKAKAQVPGDGRAAGLTLASLEAAGTILRAHVATEAPFTDPDIFVETEPYLSFSPPTDEGRDGAGNRVFRLEARDAPANTDLAGRALTLTLVDGPRFATFQPFTATAMAVSATPATALDVPSIWTMLGLALLGGFILNLMPCVLPVLSLKLMALVRHGGGDRREARIGFLASAGGIVASFLVLAAVTAALQAGGSAIGWGVQFQRPWFLVFMIALVTLFAANLAGLFEIPLPRFLADRLGGAEGRGPLGAFLTGAFATLLATPCSAPFLGTAVGFALVSGPATIIAIFAALGLGMAAPYLAVAAFPGVAGWLPRPGPWMVTLRRALALALVATGIWLGSVLAVQLSGPEEGGAQASNNAERAWLPFDRAAIAREVAAGRTVFVDVTADWCITCIANKRLVVYRDPVAARLFGDKATAVAMRADWTLPDDGIARYLASHGRYGIPFDVVYGPGAPEGIVLPELLSTDSVMEALDKAGAPAGAKVGG